MYSFLLLTALSAAGDSAAQAQTPPAAHSAQERLVPIPQGRRFMSLTSRCQWSHRIKTWSCNGTMWSSRRSRRIARLRPKRRGTWRWSTPPSTTRSSRSSARIDRSASMLMWRGRRPPRLPRPWRPIESSSSCTLARWNSSTRPSIPRWKSCRTERPSKAASPWVSTSRKKSSPGEPTTARSVASPTRRVPHLEYGGQPLRGIAQALLPQWRYLTPFATPSAARFVPAAPPPLNSPEYTEALREVRELGGRNSLRRTAEQTLIAWFWNDGEGSVTPPGHWNQIAQTASRQRGLRLAENARLFALLNITLADAAILCWEGKFGYSYWRPITAIREADRDDNPDTVAGPRLGAAADHAAVPFLRFGAQHLQRSGRRRIGPFLRN